MKYRETSEHRIMNGIELGNGFHSCGGTGFAREFHGFLVSCKLQLDIYTNDSLAFPLV